MLSGLSVLSSDGIENQIILSSYYDLLIKNIGFLSFQYQNSNCLSLKYVVFLPILLYKCLTSKFLPCPFSLTLSVNNFL